MILWAGPYSSVSFFDGSKLKTNSAMAGVTMMSTGAFTGYLAASGEINDITGTIESNQWTSTNLITASYVTFVLGGYSTNSTNTVYVSGAGSNNMNGIYNYTSDDNYEGYTNACDANNSTITLKGSYWLMTNSAGQTNYRIPGGFGLVGTWTTVLPASANPPSSIFYNESALPVGVKISGSPDRSNWTTVARVYATLNTTASWFSAMATLNLATNAYAWYTVDSGTNYCTNSWITNTFLNGYWTHPQ